MKKSTLTEVRKMQKIAGILKEDFEQESSAPMEEATTMKSAIDQIGKIAQEKGFRLRDKNSTRASWVNNGNQIVSLYQGPAGMGLTVRFSGFSRKNGTEPLENALDPKTWDKYTSDSSTSGKNVDDVAEYIRKNYKKIAPGSDPDEEMDFPESVVKILHRYGIDEFSDEWLDAWQKASEMDSDRY